MKEWKSIGDNNEKMEWENAGKNSILKK
jgi:hypothetical protein